MHLLIASKLNIARLGPEKSPFLSFEAVKIDIMKNEKLVAILMDSPDKYVCVVALDRACCSSKIWPLII